MGRYRTGRHNRQELIYWQVGDHKSDDDELRFVIVKGKIPGAVLCEALNTFEALQTLSAIEDNY